MSTAIVTMDPRVALEAYYDLCASRAMSRSAGTAA